MSRFFLNWERKYDQETEARFVKNTKMYILTPLKWRMERRCPAMQHFLKILQAKKCKQKQEALCPFVLFSILVLIILLEQF